MMPAAGEEKFLQNFYVIDFIQLRDILMKRLGAVGILTPLLHSFTLNYSALFSESTMA